MGEADRNGRKESRPPPLLKALRVPPSFPGGMGRGTGEQKGVQHTLPCCLQAMHFPTSVLELEHLDNGRFQTLQS